MLGLKLIHVSKRGHKGEDKYLDVYNSLEEKSSYFPQIQHIRGVLNWKIFPQPFS